MPFWLLAIPAAVALVGGGLALDAEMTKKFPIDDDVRESILKLGNLYPLSDNDKSRLGDTAYTLGGSSLMRNLNWQRNSGNNDLFSRLEGYVEAVYKFRLNEPIVITVPGAEGQPPQESTLKPGTDEYNYYIVKQAINGLENVAYATTNGEVPISSEDRLETFLRFAEGSQESAIEFLKEKLAEEQPDLAPDVADRLARVAFLENMIFFQEAATNPQGPEYAAIIGTLGGKDSPLASTVFSAVGTITPAWREIAESLVGQEAPLFDPSGVHWANKISPTVAAQIRTEQENFNARTDAGQDSDLIKTGFQNIINAIMEKILGLLGGLLGVAPAAVTDGATATTLDLDSETLASLRDGAQQLTIPEGMDENATIDSLSDEELRSLISANPANASFVSTATRKLLDGANEEEIAELVEYMRQQNQANPTLAGHMLGSFIDNGILHNQPHFTGAQLQDMFDVAAANPNAAEFTNYMISALMEANRLGEVTIPEAAINSFITTSLSQSQGHFAIAELINEGSANVATALSTASPQTLANIALNLSPEKLDDFLNSLGNKEAVLTTLSSMSTSQIIAALRTAAPETLEALAAQVDSPALQSALETIQQAGTAGLPDGMQLGGQTYRVSAEFSPSQGLQRA
jgi:hypothetical protein